jgi:hypothetical protein
MDASNKVDLYQVMVKSVTGCPINLFIAILYAAQICLREKGEFHDMQVFDSRRESPDKVIVFFTHATCT